MDADLRAMLDLHDGALSLADVTRAGLTKDTLPLVVQRGELRRVRRGAFVDGERFNQATTTERCALRTRAILRARPADAASHHASLILVGVPAWGVDLSHIDLSSKVRRTHVHKDLTIHPRTTQIHEVDGWWIVPAPISALQVAAASGVTAGVVALDALVHAAAATLDELHDRAMHLTCPGVGRARTALGLVDPLCESVGETRTRLVLSMLGLRFRSQVEISDRDGLIGRVDFLIDETIVVEFDGKVKYEGARGSSPRGWCTR